MLGSSIAILLAAFAAIRFPELAVLPLLPVSIAVAIAAVLPDDRGAWILGLLAGSVLAKLPSSLWLGVVTALAPVVVIQIKRRIRIHPVIVVAGGLIASIYLAAVAGSGSWWVPLGHPLDLCAALVVGATLSALTYASTQREQLGPRGRAGFRLR